MTRIESLQQFLQRSLNTETFQLEAITGDASFRRYFRVFSGDEQFIVMDSDPAKVNNAPYISLNRVFTAQGFLLPQIIASDSQRGFFLLSDLGTTHLADLLADENRELYYQQLIDLNAAWAKTPYSEVMQAYDKSFIEQEMAIFSQWLVSAMLKLEMSTAEQAMWQQATTLLSQAMIAQPKVTMHRDYHSRNIMRSNDQWAIIDYQDAVQGPVCYDLVSLLRDCYFKLPEAQLQRLLAYSYQQFQQHHLLPQCDFKQFCYWFDLTGMQRHLKAAGIFCRLYLRDGKTGYLDNLIPTLDYIIEVAAQHPQFTALGQWLSRCIKPKLLQRLSEELA